MELSEEQQAAMAELRAAEEALDRARHRLAVAKGPTHMVMPCESAVPNRKAVLCRLPSGMQGAMWEDEIRRPDPEIKVLHTDGAIAELMDALMMDLCRSLKVPDEHLGPRHGRPLTAPVDERVEVIEGTDNLDIHIVTQPGMNTETHVVHMRRLRRQRFLDRVRMAGPPPHGFLAGNPAVFGEKVETIVVERVEAAPVEFIQLDMTIAAAEPQKEVPMGEQLWVHYMVGGVAHKAGPYSPEEAEGHRADIAGFEGVTDVVVRHAESTKPYNGEDMIGEPNDPE